LAQKSAKDIPEEDEIEEYNFDMNPKRWILDDLIVLMFTAEKCKLFFNDPKFSHIKDWNEDSQEAAVTKIFAGQRKHRRSQVSKNTQ